MKIEVGGELDFSGNMNYVAYAEGDITVHGAVSITNGNSIGGQGIYSVNGNVVCESTVNIETKDIYLYAGGEGGIKVGGTATLTKSRNVENPWILGAPNGPITVNGNLTISGGGLDQVYAKGDIMVFGDAKVTNGHATTTTKPYDGRAMTSAEGSITITGSLTSSSSNSGVYAKKDITIGGDATVGVNLLHTREYIMKADSGAVNVAGKLTTTGVAQNVVFGKAGIAIGEVSINEVFRDGMDPAGCYVLNAPDGSITVDGIVTIAANPSYGYAGSVSGAEFGAFAGETINVNKKWDVVSSSAAVSAGKGIVIADGYGVTLPENGRIALVDGTYAVAGADGTLAAHAVIDQVQMITVTFDLNYEGSEPIEVKVPKGGSVAEFPEISTHGEKPDQWKLVGWYTKAASGTDVGKLGEKVTAETTFDGDSTVYAHWYLPGDVNGDGKVDNKDVTWLIRYNKYGDVEAVVPALDVNGDGDHDNKDVTWLIRYIKYGDVTIY